MVNCSGPCDQGRKPCPCPNACLHEEPIKHNVFIVALTDVLLAACIVGLIFLVLSVVLP